MVIIHDISEYKNCCIRGVYSIFLEIMKMINENKYLSPVLLISMLIYDINIPFIFSNVSIFQRKKNHIALKKL